ncbi:MAG: hypothetical protein MJ211_10200 [Bacteroidales bacterium]|nr:hypothetical protein [Bacteroidales bacterium]
MNTSKILEEIAKVLERHGIRINNFMFDDFGSDVMFGIEGYKEDVTENGTIKAEV